MVLMESTVLVVDARAPLRRELMAALGEAGFRVVQARDGREAWTCFRADPPDLVITNAVLPRGSGLELLGRIRERSAVPVVVFAAQESVEVAVAALKGGADEFLGTEGTGPGTLVGLARRLLAHGDVGAERMLAERLVGESAAARRVRDRLLGLAPLSEPVLVSGERGSGRDTVARALHELRGPGAGAFHRITPADAGHPSPLPPRATVFVDRVDRASVEGQQRIAALVARPPGRPGALRFVASSAPDLAEAVARGAFHRGLGERLLRFELRVPTLRERPEDVPRIACALAARIGRELGRPGVSLDAGATALLRRETWTGNVAELATVVEKAVAFATAPVVRRSEVEEILLEFGLSVAGLRDRAAARERRRLVAALRETGGNVTRAARVLGRSRAAVYRLVDKHGVPLRRGA
jgi:DNA-binding NtrC family response regulator